MKTLTTHINTKKTNVVLNVLCTYVYCIACKASFNYAFLIILYKIKRYLNKKYNFKRDTLSERKVPAPEEFG